MIRKLSAPERIGYAARPFNLIKRRTIKGLSIKLPDTYSSRILSTNLSGGRMKIKFDRIEKTKTNPNASGKTFPIIRVHGTALEGKNADQPWTTQFFMNNKEMAAQVEALQANDIVDVQMKKSGNYWNAVAFTKSAVPEHRAVAATPQMTQVKPENKRLGNLKIAIDILGTKEPAEEPFEYLMTAAGLADMIQDYVDEKGNFQFGNDLNAGIPEVDDDIDEPEVD